MIRAVVFDVDFTLIHPGPVFGGEGYRDFCARHGIEADPARFAHAVDAAAPMLDGPEHTLYDEALFLAYTRRIIEEMGGRGPALDACAREIYAEWAGCHHFELYEDVPDVLRQIAAGGTLIGLISNSHRSMTSFQEHFDLEGLIAAAVSSPEHGFMKPHPSIFTATLQLLDTPPHEALMVGDSVTQDVDGALRVGMNAALLHRGETPHAREEELKARRVPVLKSMTDVRVLLEIYNLQPGIENS
jgi:putative hydrolase of the HAD superfamily